MRIKAQELTDPFHILVVDDEPVARSKLAGYFEAEGYRVSAACDGQEMRRIMANDAADLVLLDINLPGEDGLSLARELRGRSQMGIILVTARSDDVDRIVGLEIGADDYVTKPFNYRELLARVKNLLRRTSMLPVAQEAKPEKRFEGWTLHLNKRQLSSPSGERVKLTRVEFELLAMFVGSPNVVLSRDRLLSRLTHRAWDPGDRTVDVLVGRLRHKIEPDRTEPELIVTVHGEGYLFAAEVE
jgi:two-component system torCAD operon response regulator TorR